MARLRLEEKLVLVFLFLSCLLYITGVSDFSGSGPFMLIMGSSLVAAYAYYLCVEYRVLNSISGRILLAVAVAAGVVFCLITIPQMPSKKFVRIHQGVFLAAHVFFIPFTFMRLRTGGKTLRDVLGFTRNFWIYPAYALMSLCWLKVVTFLTPLTYDDLLNKIDISVFGSSPDQWVKVFITNNTWLGDWFLFFYGLLGFYPVILGAIMYANKEIFQFRRLTLSFILTGFIGWVFYLFFPAIGPVYMEANLPIDSFVQVFRNCFPSLHTTWGLLVLIYAWKYKRKVFAWLLLPVSQMILATVFLRYHYIVDLAAAIPFTLFIYWLSNLLARKFVTVESLAKPAAPVRPHRQTKLEYLVLFIFILSGMTALIYEMYFLKKISLIFGSTALAVTTVLSSYMFGLAVGSRIGGKLADRVSSPIKIYGYAELLVGIFAIISPVLFHGVETLYVFIGKNWQLSTLSLTAIRSVLSIIVIMLPTLAMGATLPLLTRYITLRSDKVSRSISSLYSANLIGAALGIFLATYFLIPLLGLITTISVAVVINFLVALWAFKISKKNPGRIEGAVETETAPAEAVEPQSPETPWHRPRPQVMSVILLVGVFILGFASFAGEVIWTHLLAMVAGNSVYAFGIMLFSVLAGLAAGGYTVRNLNLTDKQKLIITGFLQLAIALFFIFQLLLWDKIPLFMSKLGVGANTFARREFIRFSVAFLMMILPTLSVGFSFPLLASLYSRNLETLGARVGKISFYNTLGNILGSVTAGFLLIPLLGSYHATLVALALALLNGLLLLEVSLLPKRRLIAFGAAAVLVIGVAVLPPWNITNLSLGTNVYFSIPHQGKVIDYWEEKDGGFTTVTEETMPDGVLKRTMWTNGKFQGNNRNERVAQARLALYPTLFVNNRKQSLVIGFGTGESAKTVKRAGFEDIDVVEISPGIIEAANKYFHSMNDGVLSAPGVNLHINDGRNFLLLNEKKYDLITMEISSIWFAGAASLYSVEFYELVTRNLADDGVFQQWMQLHHISNYDVFSLLATLKYVFKNVRLFYGGNQGVIIASNRPLEIPFDRIREFNTAGDFQPLREISPHGNIYCLLGEELLDNQELGQFLETYKDRLGADMESLLSTDDNLFLEYSTPKGNVNNYLSSLRSNLGMLGRFNQSPNNMVKNIPSEGWKYYIEGCILLGGRNKEAAVPLLEKALPLLPENAQPAVRELLESLSP